MIAGKDAVRHGEAKNSWLTGTAAWTFYNVSRYILVMPEYDGLRVAPCVPDELEEFSVTRKFRGDTYIIHVDNKAHAQKGIVRLTLDGEIVSGGVITPVLDGGTHKVEAVMG